MQVKLICVFSTAVSRLKIWPVKLIYPPPLASDAFPSKAVILLLFIHCLLFLPLISTFCRF